MHPDVGANQGAGGEPRHSAPDARHALGARRAIDGADAVDPALNLIKGGGGALLREKMVEVCAKTFVVIVDESKLCDALGPSFPLPVEITPFCHEHTLRKVAALPSLAGCEAKLRMGSAANNKVDGDEIAVTDNGNYIVDLFFKAPIKDAAKAGEELKATVGVVDHGPLLRHGRAA